ncbi:MlaD family protein [Hydrogenimonas sp.]|uniref:MlaD family protein n=1 Tax=Hydrogenimonas sp. TaxID=2231112 RepID=UPI00260265AA|nr:MlaD family protein [Hydrogenimonas sp.]
MESRANYVIVGLFVLLLSAGAVFFALWMGKINEKKKEYKYYYTYMAESVSGLPKDGAVKYMGVEIGKVKEITVDSKDPTRVRLKLRIPADFIILKSMYTQLKLEGITGIAYVEITGGKNDAKPIETEDGKIPVIPSKPSALNKLGDALPEVAVNMANAFDKIDRILDDRFIRNIQQTTANLEASSRSLEAMLNEKNAQHLQTLLANLAEASKKLQTFYETSDSLRSTADTLRFEGNRTMISIRESADSVRDLSELLSSRIEAGDFDLRLILQQTLAETNNLLRSAQSLVYQLQEDSLMFKNSPSDIFFKESEPLLGPGERP